MGKYKIGRHEFDTREEQESALRDLKKIKYLVEQLDIEDPEDTLVLYQLLREGKVSFESDLGDAFFCDISDRVADNSREMMKQGTKKEGSSFSDLWKKGSWKNFSFKGMHVSSLLKCKEGEDAFLEKEAVFKLAGIVCVVLAAVCFGVYGLSVYAENRATRKLEEVQEMKDISQAVNWYMERIQQEQQEEVYVAQEESHAESASQEQSKTRNLTVLPEYETLHNQYPDLIGWVRIEGTAIDLPVMQTGDDFYLHHNIEGEEDINGTLFMDYRDNVLAPSRNFIVYGHNMRSGSMFGSLKQYLDDGFIAKHKQIQFDTIYEKGTYEVLAVCLTEVGYQDEDGFRYYNFIDPKTTEEFNAYFDSIRECALYDNTQDVKEDDYFLTLSTCNSYVEDGRLFVVARKVQ